MQLWLKQVPAEIKTLLRALWNFFVCLFHVGKSFFCLIAIRQQGFVKLFLVHSPHWPMPHPFVSITNIILKLGIFNSFHDSSFVFQHHHHSFVKQALSALLILHSPTTDTTNAWSRTLDAAGIQFNTTMWPKNKEEILNIVFLSAVLWAAAFSSPSLSLIYLVSFTCYF